MTEAVLPPEFKIDFQIMPQTLQFNMLDENQVKLIIAVITTMLKRIQEIVITNDKKELEYIITYPFEASTDHDKAQVVIEIQYRRDATFLGKRIVVTKV
jgi:hypothetical protein